MQQHSTMSPSALVDDVLAEIFLRLPPESILCLRAVSKRWRRIATCPTFVVAYSRRRPIELLAYPDGHNLRRGAKNTLAAVDPADGGRTGCRRFLRVDVQLHLVDSRDGLLLFADGKRSFLICNPATRQWASLPPLPPEMCACRVPSGLYFHRPSGEHRVLCIGEPPPPEYKYFPPTFQYGRMPDGGGEAALPHAGPFYYILSTGAGKARRLGPVAEGQYGPIRPSACLALGGSLHWAQHPEAGGSGDIVAFDTVSETFRLIPRPPSTSLHRLGLFDMDGALAASAVPEWSMPARMDVWVLGDGDSGETWTCRARIDLPTPRNLQWCPSEAAVAVLDGDVVVVVSSGWVVLYDMKGKKTVSMVHHSRSIGNSNQLIYRASLVPLPEHDEQPCPGGEQLLQYCCADDPFMSSNGSNCGTWIVPNGI
ncbi:hypothetical protein ACP70R_028974 [Stipagrostis hirtigluma subsp. patula]